MLYLPSTTWTVDQHDGPNHLELWLNALLIQHTWTIDHMMALITSNCGLKTQVRRRLLADRLLLPRGRRRGQQSQSTQQHGLSSIMMALITPGCCGRRRGQPAGPASGRSLPRRLQRRPAAQPGREAPSAPVHAVSALFVQQIGLSTDMMALITSNCGLN